MFRIKLAEMFRGFDVAQGPAGEVFLFVECELAADFRRGTIENDRPHADENFIVDLASVHDGAVPNRDELTDDCRKPRVEMDDGVVLHIRARTDDDAVDVAPQNGSVPDARFLFEGHVADDSGARDNPGGRMNSRTFF